VASKEDGRGKKGFLGCYRHFILVTCSAIFDTRLPGYDKLKYIFTIVNSEFDSEAVSPALPRKGRGRVRGVLDIPPNLIQVLIGHPFDICAFP
jgi:hypothetical protein